MPPIATLALPASVAPVPAVPLTPSSFSKFGGVISSLHQLSTMPSVSANYGTATKITRVTPFANNYPGNASSGAPASTNFNLFRSSYPAHMIRATAMEGGFVCEAGVLEQHPFSTQTFLPMGVHAGDIAYLVICAQAGPDGLPDLTTVEAFLANGNQAVTYGPGTWHAPMISLKEVIDFGVLINENGVALEDCREVHIAPRIPIAYSIPTATTGTAATASGTQSNL
ncbi:ureidoglycolate hydrolase [Limtongia smithiae]|uniref:ureidoglycolate hydrolase n=1 Tax=Limtongia smithiae TaxID=1125753 RepID=UPI0034CD32A5